MNITILVTVLIVATYVVIGGFVDFITSERMYLEGWCRQFRKMAIVLFWPLYFFFITASYIVNLAVKDEGDE